MFSASFVSADLMYFRPTNLAAVLSALDSRYQFIGMMATKIKASPAMLNISAREGVEGKSNGYVLMGTLVKCTPSFLLCG